MRRLRFAPTILVALVAVLCIGVTACSSDLAGGNALEVNGTKLSNKDLRDRLAVISKNTAYLNKVGVKAEGSTPGTYSTDLTQQVLNQQVTFALAAQQVEEKHLDVGPDARTTAEQRLAKDLGSSTDPQTGQAGADDGTGQATLDDLGVFKPVLIDGVTAILAVQNDFTAQASSEEGLRKAYDSQADSFKNQACATAVLAIAGTGPTQDSTGKSVPPPDSDFVAAKANIDKEVAKLAAGATFEDVVTSLTPSPQATTQPTEQGIDLGCRAKGSLTQQAPELEDALWSTPLNQVSAATKADFGYFLVKVTSRGDLTFEQAKPQLTKAASTEAQTLFSSFLEEKTKSATVVVDPQYGSWNKDKGTVDPPTSSTVSTTAPAGSTATLDPLGGAAGLSGVAPSDGGPAPATGTDSGGATTPTTAAGDTTSSTTP